MELLQICMVSEILITEKILSDFFSFFLVTLYSLMGDYHHFGVTYCLLLHPQDGSSSFI